MRDVEATGEQWAHFARIVRSRRESLGLTQKDVCDREDRVSTAVLEKIERARGTKYRRRGLLGLMAVLRYTDASIERILAGQEPEERAQEDFAALVWDLRRRVEELERAAERRGL